MNHHPIVLVILKHWKSFYVIKCNSSAACDILGIISTIEENCKTPNIDFSHAFILGYLKTNEKILERKVECHYLFSFNRKKLIFHRKSGLSPRFQVWKELPIKG